MAIDIKPSTFDLVEKLISTVFIEQKIETINIEHKLFVEIAPGNGGESFIRISIPRGDGYLFKRELNLPIFMLDKLITSLEEIKTMIERENEVDELDGDKNATN